MKTKTIPIILWYILCCGCSIFVPQKDVSIFHTLGDHSVSIDRCYNEKNSTIPVINLLLDEIPSYADCPYVVTKNGGNELIFSPIHRWGEPFGDACVRALQDRLAERMHGVAMVVSSMHAIGNTLVCDYRLSIDFDDLIYNEAEKSVVVKCTWSFFDYENRKQICIHKYANMVNAISATYDDTVDAMKIALAELADDIAKKVCDIDFSQRSGNPESGSPENGSSESANAEGGDFASGGFGKN
jgi:uncharacterized lipoprotein YmbA